MSCTVLSARYAMVSKAGKFFVVIEYRFCERELTTKQLNKKKTQVAML